MPSGVYVLGGRCLGVCVLRCGARGSVARGEVIGDMSLV